MSIYIEQICQITQLLKVRKEYLIAHIKFFHEYENYSRR